MLRAYQISIRYLTHAKILEYRTPVDTEYPPPLRPTIQPNPVSNVPATSVVVAAPTSTVESAKRLAAWTAVDKHVLPNHEVFTSSHISLHLQTLTHSHSKVIGIGSGSTVPYVVERILAQGPEVNKDRVFIPTGFQSKELIVEAKLRLGDVDQYPHIDVTIDGADEYVLFASK